MFRTKSVHLAVVLRALHGLGNPILAPIPKFYFSHFIRFGLLDLAFLLTKMSHTLFLPIGALPAFPAPLLNRHTQPSPLQHTPSSVHPFKVASDTLGLAWESFEFPPTQSPAGIGGEMSFPTQSFFVLEHAGNSVPHWPLSCNAHHHHKEAAPPNLLVLAVQISSRVSENRSC